jgi:hypothetical protein
MIVMEVESKSSYLTIKLLLPGVVPACAGKAKVGL